MEKVFPGSKLKILGTETEPLIKPRILVWHTMVGSLAGTYHYFRDVNGQGFSGAESTIGIGHSTDGAAEGEIWTFQYLDREADAQFGASRWATSIENADGGRPANPFSPKQMDSQIRFALWWCEQTGVEPQIATAYDGRGFGYHELFEPWNTSHHACPGITRERQLRNYVWPEIEKRWNGGPIDPPHPDHPEFPLPRGWYFGTENGPDYSVSGFHGHANDLAQWQRKMHDRGWSITVDGHCGLQTQTVASRFQREKGLHVDGFIGRETGDAAWIERVTPQLCGR